MDESFGFGNRRTLSWQVVLSDGSHSGKDLEMRLWRPGLGTPGAQAGRESLWEVLWEL